MGKDKPNGGGEPRAAPPCPDCDGASRFLETGSASGRPYYVCLGCGNKFFEKNPAAVALGKLGGDARWKRERERQNELALKDADLPRGMHRNPRGKGVPKTRA